MFRVEQRKVSGQVERFNAAALYLIR